MCHLGGQVGSTIVVMKIVVIIDIMQWTHSISVRAFCDQDTGQLIHIRLTSAMFGSSTAAVVMLKKEEEKLDKYPKRLTFIEERNSIGGNPTAVPPKENLSLMSSGCMTDTRTIRRHTHGPGFEC
jgi:hypothetical protein